MTAQRVAAAALALLALLTACAENPEPQAQPTSPAPAPSPAAPSPAPSFLPPLQDATGLPGEQLVTAEPVELPDADEDGTARLRTKVPGGERIYLLAPARRVPPGMRPGLLMVLPAANTLLRTEYDRYRLDAFRDHGLTVVVVATVGASWNAGSCCGKPLREGVDDVAAVTAVREDALQRAGADAERVALVGHSVGALMAWRLVCEPQFRAAAVVTISGTLVHPCPKPLSWTPDVLALHGELDATVPLEGSARPIPLLGMPTPSRRATVAVVAQAAGCGPARTAAEDGVQLTAYIGCSADGSLRLAVVQDVGHPWANLRATPRTAAFLSEVLPGVR